MSKDCAVVEAELAGAPKVEADAKKINRALSDVKKTAGEGIAAGVNKSTASLQVMGAKADAVRAALSPTAIGGAFLGGAFLSGVAAVTSYLGQAADSARALGEHTSGVARRAGIDRGALDKATAEQARHSLQGADAGLDFVDAVQQLSYGGKGAAESLRDVETVATALGRSDKDLAPLIASFQTLYGLNVNVGREMNTLIERAQRLHTIGGAQAMIDAVAGMRGAHGQVSHQSQASKDKIDAFQAQAAAQLGITPAEAAALTERTISFVKSNANKIAMTPGMGLSYGDIIDPRTGQPRDPIKHAAMFKKWTMTKGKTEDERDFRVGNSFGPDALPLRHIDYDKVEAEAAREKEKRTPEAIRRAEAAHRLSREGQEEAAAARARDREQIHGDTWRSISNGVSRAGGWVADQATDVVTMGAIRRADEEARNRELRENTEALRALAETQKQQPGVSLTVKAKPAGNR